VRWDSDHVVTFDDELQAVMHSVMRADALSSVHIALDFFDASINRIAAWTIGVRNTQKALLKALLEPVNMLKNIENEENFTSRLALTEEYKAYPYGAVFNYFCMQENVPVAENYLKAIHEYEEKTLSVRA
jgi:L-rhamnose isomerase